MRMRRLACLAAVTALAALGAARAATPDNPFNPVAVVSEVIVDAEVVRLGDLFHGLGERADAVVGDAPAPGATIRLSAAWLNRIAADHGLDWQAPGNGTSVMLHRAVQTVGADAITEAIAVALARRGRGADRTILLNNANQTLELPTDVPGTVAVTDLNYYRSSDRFSATVVAPATGEPLARATVTGRAVRMLEVPVPAERIDRGAIIDEDDLRWITLPSDRLHRNHITDAERIVGMSARRSLRPNEPLRTTAVEKPELVSRNSLVLLKLQTERMTLTAQGRALEDGAKGEVVRVINTASKTTVTGVVTASNVVMVQPVLPSLN